MCGICGIWGKADSQSVEAMVAAMHHRGPDDQGIFCAANTALGMTRLAIIDLSLGGHQPMETEDGLVTIVYNGEIYNYRSERDILEKQEHTFRSESDTEVILKMYVHYGDDFLTRLRGMFALAIFDRRKGSGHERLLLARDQMGIKPLMITQVGGRIVFASEIKALLASGLIQREIDPIAVRHLLTYGSVVQPRTILKNVSMLLPAHRMIVDQGGTRIERYWELSTDRHPGSKLRPYEELVEELRLLLTEAVQMQMISDVPLGAFLSGGVDSSILVAMMAGIAGSRVKTFSVGFRQEGAGIDESEDARRTAGHLGTDHTAVIVEGQEVRQRIEHIACALDQPSVDGVNAYFVSLAARQGVTVAISGTGGDELFAGYPRFAAMSLARANGLRRSALRFAGQVARQPVFDRLIPSKAGQRIASLRSRADFVSRYSATYQIFGAHMASRLLAPALRAAAGTGRADYYDVLAQDELPGGSIVQRTSGLVMRGYLNNQLLRDIDATSMIHSLEVRVPYLDPCVVNFALSLPDDAKLGSVTQRAVTQESNYREMGAKRILIDAGRPYLEKDFDLQPKRGFGMPFEAWLRGLLRDVLDDTLSETQVRQRGLLIPEEVSWVKTRFLERQLHWSQPWMLMILELWQRHVLDVTD